MPFKTVVNHACQNFQCVVCVYISKISKCSNILSEKIIDLRIDVRKYLLQH